MESLTFVAPALCAPGTPALSVVVVPQIAFAAPPEAPQVLAVPCEVLDHFAALFQSASEVIAVTPVAG